MDFQVCQPQKTRVLCHLNTQVQSHALLRRGFGTSVPFILSVASQLAPTLMFSIANLKLKLLPMFQLNASVVMCCSHCC